MKRKQKTVVHSVNLRNCAALSSRQFKHSLGKYLVKRLELERIIPSEDPTCCAFCLRFSPDGRFLAWTAAEQVQIWDFDANKLFCLRNDHQEIVTSLAWLNVGRNRKYSSRNEIKNEEGHTSPSKTRLDNDDDEKEEEEDYPFFTCSLDKTIKFYRKFTPVATLTEHADWIRCLAVNVDNSRMISGCVSSQIMGWNIETLKPVFSIHKAHFVETLKELNTINSLQYSQYNRDVFLSGARDGYVKIWDARMIGYNDNNNKAVITFQAHTAKLNCASWSYNDCFVLTGGRDNAVRLWDTRKLPTQNVTKEIQFTPLREYTSHRCSSYNVASCFFNNEQNVVTGSENNQIYIYDTWSGELVKKLKILCNTPTVHPPVVHLLQPRYFIDDTELTLVSSSINESSIQIWKPKASVTKKKRNTQRTSLSSSQTTTRLDDSDQTDSDSDYEEIENAEDPITASQRAVIEELMKKHGDQILRLFHKYNFTFSSQQDWNHLIQTIENNPNNDDSEIIQVVNEIATDFAKLFLVQQHRLITQRANPSRSRQVSRRHRQSNNSNNTNNNHPSQRRHRHTSSNRTEEARPLIPQSDTTTNHTNNITTSNRNNNNTNNNNRAESGQEQSQSRSSENSNLEPDDEAEGHCTVQ